ncbi:MAG: type III polyketide synthase, partial [Deltaproteobacteria bacterium]|nr:type III polyketide synthase [Deltaproteobacteria bacterium]
MPYLKYAQTSHPKHEVQQRDVVDLLTKLFHKDSLERKQVSSVFAHAGVKTRQLVKPLAWYAAEHSLAERNRVYLHEGFALLEEACKGCLTKACLTPNQIDHIITVSSTGLATPSLDALLIDALGLMPSISRVPVWGLGCAGGVMAISMAHDFLLAYPERTVLIAALETCSLTFQKEDLSRKNIVGAALFGDGAGAALLGGSSKSTSHPRLIAHRQHLFSSSKTIMGWDIVNTGFQLILARELPQFVEQHVEGIVRSFLDEYSLKINDLKHILLHPGGPKVLEAVLKSLSLSKNIGHLAEEVLADHGNLSSV